MKHVSSNNIIAGFPVLSTFLLRVLVFCVLQFGFPFLGVLFFQSQLLVFQFFSVLIFWVPVADFSQHRSNKNLRHFLLCAFKNLFQKIIISQKIIFCTYTNICTQFLAGKVILRILYFSMILSDFAPAAVLISFGAVIGKVSRLQLFVMGVFEKIFHSIDENILVHHLKITELVIH